MKTRLWPYLALVVATLFWAGNYVIGASAIHQMSTFSLVFLRWAVAFVPLVIIAHVVERPNWRKALAKWPLLILLGALGLTGYNFFLYFSLHYTSALNASLINALNPAVLVIAAVIFIKDKVTTLGIVGLVVSFVGVVIILTRGNLTYLFSHPLNQGDLLMFGAILCWTAYTLIARKFTIGIPPITSTAIQVGLVLVVLAVFIPFNDLAWPASAAGTWSLLYIAVFPSILSYVLWNGALQKLAPSKAAIFMNLIPVFTAIAAVLLGQHISWVQIIGGSLVIGGVLLTSNLVKSKQQAPAQHTTA